jgi:hypothetical protein
MWLEIRGNDIVGIHSHQCENTNLWVEHHGEARVGDYWKNKKVVKRIEDDADDMDRRRIAAQSEILKRYPVWQQLNILRKNDPVKIDEMGKFIDGIQAWSNDLKQPKDHLSKLTQ